MRRMPSRQTTEEQAPRSGGQTLPEHSTRDGSHSESGDWHHYLVVLRRRLWSGVAVFAAVFIAGIVYGFVRVPVYQAKVRLLIDRDASNVVGFGNPLAQDSEIDFQTQLTILESRSLARRTLRALGTLPKPGVDAPTGAAPAGPPARGRGEDARQAAVINDYLAAVRINRIADSRLVDVYFSSTEPDAAARAANTMAEQYINQYLEGRSNTSREVTDWLNERLAEQRKTLEASQKALQDYREQHASVPTTEFTGYAEEELSDLITAHTKAKTERIEKGTLYVQAQALLRNPASLESFPTVLSSPYVQQLKAELETKRREQAQLSEKLGVRHPLLIKANEAVQTLQTRLQTEMAKIVESVHQDYLAAQGAETTLGQTLESQKRQSLLLSRSDVQLAVLQHDVTSNRQIYDNLNQRLNEFAVTRQQRSSNISIVDHAEVPQKPTGPDLWTDMRYATLGGLVLALCVVFCIEYFDNKVKSPNQIQALGLALLALVPRVDPASGEGSEQAVGENAIPPLIAGAQTPPAFDEAFRHLRTNLRMSSVTDGTRRVVVTSAGTGDGKSVVASSLAVTLALGEDRVLLVDADLRRPTLHKRFDLPQAPGLSELLTGQAAAAEVVHHTGYPRLDVVSSGKHPPNPSEVLESRRFEEQIALFEREYDWVILDSPPVMPVTDAIIIAATGADVIVVVSAEATPLPALRGALQQLNRTGSRILGAVLNRADLKRRGYYYTDYYHPDYARYYTSTTDS